MEQIRIEGWLKIKRRSFWSDRYAIIQNQTLYYFKEKTTDTKMARGWVDLNSIQIKLKIVFPDERIAVVNKTPQSSQKNNKLAKYKEFQIKFNSKISCKEWLHHMTHFKENMNRSDVNRNGSASEVKQQMVDCLLKSQRSYSADQQGVKQRIVSNIDQSLLDHDDVFIQKTKNKIQNRIKALDFSQNKLVEVQNDVSVYISDQNHIKVISEVDKIQLCKAVFLVLLFIVLNQVLKIVPNQSGLIVVVLLIQIVRQAFVKLRVFRNLQFKMNIECNINQIIYILKYKIDQDWNLYRNGDLVQNKSNNMDLIFGENKNVYIAKNENNGEVDSLVEVRSGVKNNNGLVVSVYKEINGQQMVMICKQMQGLKNYIEMQKASLNGCNQYLLENGQESSQESSEETIRISQIQNNNQQQYNKLQQQQGGQQEQEEQEILKQSNHGRNLLELRQRLDYLRRMNTQEGRSADGWYLYSEKEGITIYTKEESNYVAVMSKGTIPLDIETVWNFISSMESKKIINAKQFDHGHNVDMELLLAKCYQIDDNNKQFYSKIFEGFNYTYQKNKRIFIMQARDFLQGNLVIRGEKSIEVVNQSFELAEYPAIKEAVRAEIKIGGWIMKEVEVDGKVQTNLMYLKVADPKGNIPNKLKKMSIQMQGMCINSYRDYLLKKV